MQLDRLAPAQSADREHGTRMMRGDARERLLGASQRRAVDGRQDVAGLQARLLGGAADIKICDEYPAMRQPKL